MKIETLEDVKQHIAHETGQNDEKWRNQQRTNSDHAIQLSDHTKRLTAVERRLAIICAIASLVGGTASSLIVNTFNTPAAPAQTAAP